MKKKLLAEIEPGQVRKGVVKNIAEFGAFVDLGGIDGLLHITDMSWGRVTNPHEVVQIDQELEVYILHVDREKEKIALGLKQKTPSPWENVEAKYPVGSRHSGEVVNVMSYGAFVKLEPGIEGLVHISEMSWTKRINHPSELVQHRRQDRGAGPQHQQGQAGNLAGHEAGASRTRGTRWPRSTRRARSITGVVRNLTNYGAFIEIEEGIDGLLHVSDMSWVRKVANPSEVVQKGEKVTCVVLNVDQERKRVALGLKQMANDPWEGDIPGRYQPGEIGQGKVTKLTNFGVFVELEPGLEGPAAHLRAGRPQGREPRGRGQGRRRDRGQGPARRRGGPQDRPVACGTWTTRRCRTTSRTCRSRGRRPKRPWKRRPRRKGRQGERRQGEGGREGQAPRRHRRRRPALLAARRGRREGRMNAFLASGGVYPRRLVELIEGGRACPYRFFA